ncbi:MAG: hypothetical protein HC876_06035 [Chloroflexaceae bacterium]|nr:hypothetical protein [Chloroflexaceae bacterium]
MVLDTQTLIGIVIAVALGMVVGLVALHHSQALAGRLQARRPLRAFDVIRDALGRSAETGRALHLSPGAGTLGNRATTAETIVGLLAVERVASEAARNGATVLVSSGDVVAHLALRGVVRQVYQRTGQGQNYNPEYVQLLTHQDNTAYATGVATLYARQRLEASQIIGSFEPEFLLCGEEGAQRNIPQVAGATTNATLPLMLLSTQGTLIGEEVFAAEAYLSSDVTAQARLRTQDTLRIIVIILLIAGVLYSVVQYVVPQLGLPPLPRA